jgi:hypothetical protein
MYYPYDACEMYKSAGIRYARCGASVLLLLLVHYELVVLVVVLVIV